MESFNDIILSEFHNLFLKNLSGGDMPETDANAHSKTTDSNIHDASKSLKIADNGAEDEDTNRHLAKIAIQRVSFLQTISNCQKS